MTEPISPEQLAELERLAKAATPHSECTQVAYPVCGPETQSHRDAAFIAACSPDVVLGLLARVREAEARAADYARLHDAKLDALVKSDDHIATLTAERDALRAKMTALADHWSSHGTEGPQCVDELRGLAEDYEHQRREDLREESSQRMRDIADARLDDGRGK